MTHAEIAAAMGLTESGVQQAVRRYGLSKPRISHKWAVPWVVEKGPHSNGRVKKYLRDLSSLAQGKEIGRDNAATALRWAQELVEQELDIDYDRDTPPNEVSNVGGFYSKPAVKNNWHLLMVLNRAKAGLTKKL
ncbi:hypothetical protein [Spirillospora sp. CA-294931]|uniref:hypothetical protein n=1 Tax=Spirillospora sp. CA-294931 TaxID=3240042 RepID=UPI003D8CE905